MQGKIIRFEDYTVLVEYKNKGNIERCFLPRTLIGDVSLKGTLVRFNEKETLPYGVDLSKLEAPQSIIQKLEQKLKANNIWTAEDYKREPSTIRKVAREFGLDPVLILNAASRQGVIENGE